MIKFEMYTSLDEKTTDELWRLHVNMDDWDYVLFVGMEHRDEFIICENDYSRGNLEPKSYLIDKLLTGCCTNAWYEVKDFMGREGILGIAYHS
jgi:hypothetical protein